MNNETNQFFKSNKVIYFIGIGGIGISAIAKLAITQGSNIFGTDLNGSDIINGLIKLGANITISQSPMLPSTNIDLIIYTTAAPTDHHILKEAQRLKIPIMTYPQALGAISQKYFTIAVSGMHGKSTTTSILGLLLESAGLDPLVIVGTKLKEWGGNVRIEQESKNKSQKIFVVEADEYRSAMLELAPNIIILTRIEEDHLDYYRDLNHIKNEFKKYLKKLPSDGIAIANWNDVNIKSVVDSANCQVIKYNDAGNDDAIIKKIKGVIKVPGRHNLENALAAYKVGERLNLSEADILQGLAKFTGTWRRLEYVGKLKIKNFKLKIISDYAHHPTEIHATIQAIREKYPKKRILLAYQPHQHNRTKKLYNQFINCFDQADILILSEIFDVAGREESADQNVSSLDLVKEINQRIDDITLAECYYSSDLKSTKKKILELAQQDDIIIIMGAGDIDSVARKLVH